MVGPIWDFVIDNVDLGVDSKEPELFGLFLNFGNISSTESGNYEFASYEYGENNGKLEKIIL